MRDLCGEISAICASYLKGLGLEKEKLCLKNADCEAACALREGNAPTLPPVGHGWFEQPLLIGNRICFSLSDSFYKDAAAHILKEAVPLRDGDVWDGPSYARERMRILSRKGGEDFPPGARRALWRAMSAYAVGVSEKTRKLRLEEAAALSLEIGQDVPLRERAAYMEGCGLAAACLLRLL